MGDSHQRRVDFGQKRRGNDANTDGSPWQAMKRLRVAEDRAVGIYADDIVAPPPEPNAGDNSSLPPFNWYDRAALHQEYRDSRSSEQDAGQDTMSEGCDLTSPSRLSPTKNHSSPLKSQQDDDVDYHSVNHILGALHLGRRQREEQPLHQTETNALQYSPLPSRVEPAPTPPTMAAWPDERSYLSPPPKPSKRRVAHLLTSSKLA